MKFAVIIHLTAVFLYLNITGIRQGHGENASGVLESPGYFLTKTVGTLAYLADAVA